MKLLTYKYKIIAALVIIAAFVVLFKLYMSERNERIRTEGNQTVLLDSIRHYKTESGLNVASNGRLLLKVNELKAYRADATEVIKELRLKNKRVKTIQNTVTETKTEIKTVIEDRIVYRDGKTDTLKCIDYVSPYLTINGCVENNKFNGLIQSRDTLTQVVHRIPRKFLFIKWGTKAIRQEVFGKNPDTLIEFAEYIEIKKRNN